MDQEKTKAKMIQKGPGSKQRLVILPLVITALVLVGIVVGLFVYQTNHDSNQVAEKSEAQQAYEEAIANSVSAESLPTTAERIAAQEKLISKTTDTRTKTQELADLAIMYLTNGNVSKATEVNDEALRLAKANGYTDFIEILQGQQDMIDSVKAALEVYP